MPPSAIRLRTVSRSSGALARYGPIGISGVIWSEKIVRPTLSCRPTLRKKLASPPFARSRRFSSAIEPEVSTTSSTFAGLRSSRHARRTASSTRGSGRPSTRFGCAGSTPFSFETGGTGSSSRLGGRKPDRAASSGVISSSRNCWKRSAPWRCAGRTQGASSTMNGLSE